MERTISLLRRTFGGTAEVGVGLGEAIAKPSCGDQSRRSRYTSPTGSPIECAVRTARIVVLGLVPPMNLRASSGRSVRRLLASSRYDLGYDL
jgi:hypothetical protein